MQNITFYPTTLTGGNLVIDKSTLDKINFCTKEKAICYLNKSNELVIRKQKEICIFCGRTDYLHTISESSICDKCRDDLREYAASQS